MISNFLLNSVYGLILFFVDLLPQGEPFSAEYHDAAILIGTYTERIGGIFPVQVLAACIIFIISGILLIFAFKTFVWIIGIFRGSGH